MTTALRVELFNIAAARRWPGSQLWMSEEAGHPVAYGRWVLGADFRGRTGFPGEYRPGYLARLDLLFADIAPARTLHAAAPGALLAWLDGVWPQHRKVVWQTTFRIAVTGATNQRLRDLTVFERMPA